jgi:hypothetical protein
VSFASRDRASVGVEGARREVEVAGPGGPVAGLAAALYGFFYCVPSTPAPDVEGDAEAFLAGLRAANPIRQRLEGGWTIVQIDQAGLLLADARGRRRRAAAQEVAPYAGGLAPGQPARLAMPREMVTAPGGHYAILGRPVHEPRTGRQVRFYWNVAPNGAASFLAAVGAGLERRRIPFQAKVPVAPALYRRADCGVLYLGLEDIEASLDLVAGAWQSLRGSLRPETPLFARRLAAGLAFAESPPSGDSFGMHRCRLVAEGLLTAFDRGASDADARLRSICDRLTGYGLDLAALERNPATSYPYRLESLAA